RDRPQEHSMANLTQEEKSVKPVSNPSEVPSVLQKSNGDFPVKPAVVPCLIPSFADAVKLLNARYSCLVLDKHRRHVSLPPVYIKKKRAGIEHELNKELLKFSSSLNGVPMAYSEIKVVGKHGDILDDQGFIHLNIEASFVIFKPESGSKLVGVVNKLAVGHVGCLVHGCFNASVVKPSGLSPEQWRNSGFSIGHNLEFEVFKVRQLMGQVEEQQETVEASSETETKEGGEVPEECLEMPEMNCNSHKHHKEKKKKKKDKRRESEEVSISEMHTSDSSGYMSDKTLRKRAMEDENSSETPPAKKKKKSKRSASPSS
ncbi:hypothetical protein DNTS_021694, partial [Danionella cerebrum]